MATVAVITFPGSNCDADLRNAVDSFDGMEARAVWHKEARLGQVDAVMLPGGFSYGDYLRSGAIARFSPVMDDVIAFARRGGPVLGICNGFQVLTEAGILPGALLRNAGLKFLCQDVDIRAEGRSTPFTRHMVGTDRTWRIPIAHMDGNFTASDAELERIEGEGQVVFRYASTAPNGSRNDIAGVCNPAGNVVGLMPHPERVVEAVVGGEDGRPIFESLVEALA